MDKWAGGDPPFPICGEGEREPRIIISSDVGMYGTKKIKDEVDRSTQASGGDQSIAMAEEGGGKWINPPPPRR